jgi:N-acetylglucosamine-6-phosphate deacetylase
MKVLAGCLLTPGGWLRGVLRLDDGRIESIGGEPIAEDLARAAGLPLVVPGFIDLHVHGGGGFDVMDGAQAAAQMARLHARHGTTALLATTMTAPLVEIEAALHALAPACARRPAGAAALLGVHLEGPYISSVRLGAQPDFARAPTLDEIMALHGIAPIRVVTLAPEIESALALIPSLVAAGMRVQIGHSNATYEQAVEAMAHGARGTTHLFNAMSAFHHRAPGAAGAALAHAMHAELIPDLLHVHPGAMRAALRAIPGLYGVTDATAAAGMPDGEYRLGRQRVSLCRGCVRLGDGTLAGSALTMDLALRNLVAIGLPLADAAARLSLHPADYLGLADRGRIVVGARADLVLLAPQSLVLQQVLIEGGPLEPAP